jgi:hypothetical protein
MLEQRESGIVTTDGSGPAPATRNPRPPEQWWVVNARSPDGRIPEQRQLVAGDKEPDTIAGWKALVEGLLTNHCCAFHRNMEISARYAWMYNLQPARFKWAAMAAVASHHVRLALFPLRLDADGTGYVDIPRSLGRRKLLLTADVDTIRATNNAIFNDIFWVHLAYRTTEDGIERLRALLQAERHYAPVLSCAFARLVSIGATTSFEVRGVRQEVAYFTSFYVHSLTRGVPDALRAHAWPRITRFDDRWRWLVTSVVPRFRRLDADARLIDASLQRISDEARVYASIPCVPPR